MRDGFKLQCSDYKCYDLKVKLWKMYENGNDKGDILRFRIKSR